MLQARTSSSNDSWLYDFDEWRAVSTVPCTTYTSAPACWTTSARSLARAGTVDTAQGTPAALIALMRSAMSFGLTGSRETSFRTALISDLSVAAVRLVIGAEISYC